MPLRYINWLIDWLIDYMQCYTNLCCDFNCNCNSVMSPPVDRGKRQTASEVAGRQPMLHYWDWEEPRLLVCEAEFVATPDSQKNSTTNATTATTTDTKTNKPVGIQAVRCCRLFFSRSYCYTVWSAIGIILLSVCLWHCAFWLSVLVYTAKSYTSVFLARTFLFVPSDTFSVGCIV